jgi:hypothetical protein
VIGLVLSPAALNPVDAAWVSVGALLMGGLLLAAVRCLDGRSLTDAALWATTLAMISSLVLVALSVGQTNFHGRAMGVFANPNTLGMVSALWFALALTRSRFWIPVLPLSLAAIVLSGSRGALLAWCAGLFVWLWRGGAGRRHRAGLPLHLTRLLLVGILAVMVHSAVVHFTSADVQSPDQGIARTSESGRLLLLQHAWQRFLERSLTGWGLGTEHIEGVSHPHVLPATLAMQLGIAGILVAAATIWALIGSLRNERVGASVLGAFAVTAMVAESWLFGVGSFLAWSFWFGFAGQLSQPSEPYGLPLGQTAAPVRLRRPSSPSGDSGMPVSTAPNGPSHTRGGGAGRGGSGDSPRPRGPHLADASGPSGPG